VRAFVCQNCGLLATFESVSCVRCGAQLGFDWPTRELVGPPESEHWRCANAALAACNWIAPADGELCFSCALTLARPADGDADGIEWFAKAEAAKRRLLFELGELGLPIPTGEHAGRPPLRFELLSSAERPVTTGHADGLITLDLAEANDPHRVRMREEMDEPYRTLLGHFRHEVGHFYFPILCPDEERLTIARAAFGDERDDYQAALERHYEQGAPAGWERTYVSAYATMHPMEDWAESFAHLLHIRDALQTAAAHGLAVTGPQVAPGDQGLAAAPEDVEGAGVRALLGDWLALTYALNAVNRSMGLDDLYPFVLSPAAVDKLAVIDRLMRRAALPAGSAAAA
jgi:hypothetical protein